MTAKFMRIVHIVQSLGMGGQERLILDFSRELAKRGHEPTVISLEPGGELRSEFGSIPVIDVTRKQGFDALAVGRLTRKFAELRPDVVHTHNPSPLCHGIPAARALRIRNTVHTKHGANHYGPRSLRLAQMATQLVGAFVAVSEVTKEQARGVEHPRPSRLHVIANGIPLTRFVPNADARKRIRAELGIPEGAFVVGSVGRLMPEKDYPLLVRAVSPMLGNDFRLVLVGEGSARQEVMGSVPEPLRDYVHFTGLRRDVQEVLCSFDVFALSSKTEGLPLVVPEAMATGLPIVTTAVGGLPSVVHEGVGKLVPSGDEIALRSAINLFVKNPEVRAAIGKSALADAHERYSIERMTDRYLELYEAGADRNAR